MNLSAVAAATGVPRSTLYYNFKGADELTRWFVDELLAEIGERIALAREQLDQADSFDYVIENDDLERAVEELTELVRGLLAPAGTMSRP